MGLAYSWDKRRCCIISSTIKKSKNPTEFWSIVSEIKVASYLIDKVDSLTIITDKNNASPEFKITVSNIEITIEVKKIEDKFEKGLVEFVDESKTIYTSDDITTTRTAFTKSIEKGQYIQNMPHIIIFDCCPDIDEIEFEDVLCPQKDKQFQLTNDIVGHSTYDGLFYKKDENDEYSYQMVSGVVAFLKSYEIFAKGPQKVFYSNPNSSYSIPYEIINKLGFQTYNL